MENREVLSARFTNREQTIIEAIYNDNSNEDPPFAIIIEAKEDDHEYKMLNEMGWNEEKIIDCTAEYKKQAINTMNNIAKTQAGDVYKEELARLQSHVLRNKSLVLQNKALLEKQKADILMGHATIRDIKQKAMAAKAMENKIEKEIPKKIESANSFVNNSIDENKLSESFDKIITFLKTVNENKEAIEILKQKSKAKNIKPKTVTEVLFKHIIK